MLRAAVLALLAAMLVGSVCAQRVTPASEVFGNPISQEADDWLTDSNEKYNEALVRLRQGWLANVSSFNVDIDSARIVFAGPAGTVVFDARVVGTVRHRDKSWEWGWNNPNVSAQSSVPEQKLKELGKRFDLRYLTHGMVPVPMETFPFMLSGIALKLYGGVGVYRAPGKEVDVYLLLANPRKGAGS